MTYLIDAKTPKGQAAQMLRAVNAEARTFGYAENASLIKETVRRSDNKVVNHWRICWEEGPFDWGTVAGGGGGIWNMELGQDPYRNSDGSFVTPTFQFADHVSFEHNYSFDIIFYTGW